LLCLAPTFAHADDPEEVVVFGARNTTGVAGLTQPILDTPQTITVIPREIIELQGSTDLRDVLKNDPSVQIHANEDSAQGTNVYIRGFSARFDTYLDGMLDLGSYFRDPFFLEQVNVLTGPSSVLFGRGSTGGVVEQVSKRPGADPFVNGSFAVGTEPSERLTADVNMPFGEDAAFRVNGLLYNSDIAGRDVGGYQRFGIAPSVIFGLNSPTQVLISLLHQSDWDTPDYGVPWIDLQTPSAISHPASVPWNNYYGFKSNYVRTSADILTATVTHELSDQITLRNQFRFASFERNYRATAPAIDGLIPADTPLDSISVDRVQRGGFSQETLLDDQFGLTATFETYGISHTLVFGAEFGRQTSDPTVLKYSGVPSTNLIYPDINQPFAGTAVPKSIVSVNADTEAGYLVDTMQYGPVEVDAAARIDRFAASYSNQVPSPVFYSHADVRPSFRGAVVYKATPDVSIYAVYGTSFDPSAEGLSLSAATANLSPERSHTVETGVKWAANDRLLLSAALFRTVMVNLRETSPIDPTVQILAGTARSEGFELLAQGHVTDEWMIIGGYTYLNATVISSPDADVGNRLQNTPRHNIRLWSSYDVMPELTLGGGINYQSNRVPNSFPDSNDYVQRVPGYWTASLLARYKINDLFSVQFNLDNLFDRRYYDGLDDNHVEVGEGRSARITFILTD
jgi:catecholate siderophore receptor